jgi:alanyl aminopeptidase
MTLRWSLLATLAACGGAATGPAAPRVAPAPASAPTSASAPVAVETAPTLRLPAGVTPVRYALDLWLRPDADSFTGRVTIDVDLASPTPTLWLNAVDLTLDEVVFEVAGAERRGAVVRTAPGFVGLSAGQPLPAGRARVTIGYRGKVRDGAVTGLFRVKDGGRWYLLSKFEPIFARTAFPGFDEPGYKAPLALTLHVPRDLVARANTPASAETDEPDGLKTVRFAETRPLPTYLYAWCVGPFDILDAGRHGRNRTPIQILVPAGRRAAAGFAAAATPALFTRLEDYFDVPYPFEKLDLVAVPEYPGAMENAGLVLYGATTLLIEPHASTVAQRKGHALVIAHETAHMWFGDLVTTAWWDDLWLNEGFATWVESKIVDAWQPGWQIDLDRARDRAYALEADALSSARQIRQPIASEDDIFNAFDAITYEKGASVLTMFEAWLGPDLFRAGVTRYLKEHGYKSATSADFLAALGAAAGKDITGPFATFLDQPGAPLISVKLDCGPDAPPTVRLAQRRYRPVGSSDAAPGRPWSVPVCVKVVAEKGPIGACALLDGAEGALPLPEAKKCPTWLFGNEGGVGYYQTGYDDGMLARMATALPVLTPRERFVLATDLGALVVGGRAPAAAVLGLLPALAADREPRVALAAVAVATRVGEVLVGPDQRAAWAAFVTKTFGPRARALGWRPRRGEDEATRELRGPLLTLVAVVGGEAKLAAEGTALGARWLDDKKAVDPDVRVAALTVLAHTADGIVLTRLRDTLRGSRDLEERRLVLRTLAQLHDPAVLRQALALLVSDELNPRDALRVVIELAAGDPSVGPEIWAFVREHHDELAARLPPNWTKRLITLGDRLCTAEGRADVEAFFAPRAARLLGGPRALRQTLERIDACIVARAAQRDSLALVLAR